MAIREIRVLGDDVLSRRRPRINEKMQTGGEDDTKNQRADRRHV